MDKAVVIIDMQAALVTGAHREEEVLHALGHVTRRARSARVPVVYVQRNHASFRPMMKGESGWQIHPAIAPGPGDIVVEKEASDAFYGTELATLLLDMGVNTVLLAGMQTKYCVDATARSALSHDFDVVLLSDCHTTRDSDLKAEKVIVRHNAILPNVLHPSAKINAISSTELVI